MGEGRSSLRIYLSDPKLQCLTAVVQSCPTGSPLPTGSPPSSCWVRKPCQRSCARPWVHAQDKADWDCQVHPGTINRCLVYSQFSRFSPKINYSQLSRKLNSATLLYMIIGAPFWRSALEWSQRPHHLPRDYIHDWWDIRINYDVPQIQLPTRLPQHCTLQSAHRTRALEISHVTSQSLLRIGRDWMGMGSNGMGAVHGWHTSAPSHTTVRAVPSQAIWTTAPQLGRCSYYNVTEGDKMSWWSHNILNCQWSSLYASARHTVYTFSAMEAAWPPFKVVPVFTILFWARHTDLRSSQTEHSWNFVTLQEHI